MTLQFEPGGVPLDTLPIDGYIDTSITLRPDLLDAVIYDLVLAFTGTGSVGVTDEFCVPTVYDFFPVPYVSDQFAIPPGRLCAC